MPSVTIAAHSTLARIFRIGVVAAFAGAALTGCGTASTNSSSPPSTSHGLSPYTRVTTYRLICPPASLLSRAVGLSLTPVYKTSVPGGPCAFGHRTGANTSTQLVININVKDVTPSTLAEQRQAAEGNAYTFNSDHVDHAGITAASGIQSPAYDFWLQGGRQQSCQTNIAGSNRAAFFVEYIGDTTIRDDCRVSDAAARLLLTRY